ncbi:MAG TPA: MFS transporter [Actinophytocola sp.]|uniref:MFS transporter n=1 Tax=Actinophytocola sp. TaxID=1872138 RepID=UPI002DBA6A15|nr:MFS transporter [Actinophytocola sp.]HEU5474251.1 MFS transporter [Actinophytocola sp.]
MAGAARYREVFAVGEFRALLASHLLSIIGDQLARVALAVLVFDRTGSPALAALTFALTLVPELIGGPLLAGIGDRRPRRAVMIGCDLARAALVAFMAVPGLSLWLLGALLVAVQLVGSPFKAARAAILPEVLAGDRFEVGTSVLFTSLQIGMLCGYGAGAPLVAWLGTGWALLIDAGTFAASAVVVAAGVGPHPPVRTDPAKPVPLGGFRETAALVWRDRRLRYLVAMASLVGFYAAPTGLAVPYAAQIGAGTAAAGLLLAALPAGSALGAVLLTRLVDPERRRALLGPLAVATCAALLPMGLAPGLAVAVGLCALCGLLSGHDSVSVATFTRTVPAANRGQAYGLALAVLRAAQGVGIALSGVLAEVTTPSTAIAVFAAIGTAAGCGVAVGWQRARSATVAGTTG